MDQSQTTQKLYEVEGRVRVLEGKHEDLVKIVATQGWVKEQLTELRESSIRQESTLSSLTDQIKGVFSSYKELLTERGLREKEEHREKMEAVEKELQAAKTQLASRSFLNLAGNTKTVVGTLAAVIALITTISGFVAWVILYVVNNHPK